MTNLPAWRQRYTQFLVVCILSIFIFVMCQSLNTGTAQFETSIWNRDFLVSIFSKLRLKLGDHVFHQGLVAKDGWREFTAEMNLDDFQNALPFSPNGIQQKAQILYENLQARHTTLVIVIAPNKATIYPEKLPDEIQKINQQSRLDLLVASFKQHGPPVLIDLRPALRQARNEQTIYFKTDTHWNSLGAFAAYTEIMRVLAKSHPELAPHPLQDFRLQTLEPGLRDIPRVMGATSPLESEIELTPKFNTGVSWIRMNKDPFPATMSRVPNDQLPRLLMYGDSFGEGLIEFFAPHFREATFVSNGSGYPDLKTIKMVDRLHPDIVIIEVVERAIPFLDIFLSNYKLKKEVK